MSLARVIARLEQLHDPLAERWVHIGTGPRHPHTPDRSLEEDTETLIAAYPFLARDGSYVEFLRGYSGLFVKRGTPPARYAVADLYGFSDVATDLVDPEFALVDEDGFFHIGALTLRDASPLDSGTPARSAAIMVDAARGRDAGVLVRASGEVARYGSFIDALERLAGSEGDPEALWPTRRTPT